MDVAVLAGGRSPEHDISLASATQVLRHLDRARWRAWPVFLDRDGGFWPSRTPLPAGEAWRPGDPAQALGPLRPGRALDWLLEQVATLVVFPVLHGPFGEDGTVQGMLELYDLPFVGSGCAASAVAMDKIRARQALGSAGLPMAKAHLPLEPLGQGDAEAEFQRLVDAVGLPCFCKLPASGSSRGVERVASFADFVRFREQPAGRLRRWFAEAAVAGEEITVAVLGNQQGTLRALPPVGIYPHFCNYFDERAKYEPGACDELVPPRGLSPSQVERAQELALACHHVLGCDGMSRTDMIQGKDGPVVLEVNTIPGLTAQSLLPKAAAAAGWSFAALLDHLLALALEARPVTPTHGLPAPAAVRQGSSPRP